MIETCEGVEISTQIDSGRLIIEGTSHVSLEDGFTFSLTLETLKELIEDLTQERDAMIGKY